MKRKIFSVLLSLAAIGCIVASSNAISTISVSPSGYRDVNVGESYDYIFTYTQTERLIVEANDYPVDIELLIVEETKNLPTQTQIIYRDVIDVPNTLRVYVVRAYDRYGNHKFVYFSAMSNNVEP